MYDIVFCALPPLALDRVYSAPALLKGLVISKGYKAKTFDFAIELFKRCNKEIKIYTSLLEYFWSTSKILTSDEKLIIDGWYDSVIDTLLNCPTRFIGLSVFSSWTHKATLEIILRAQKLKFADKLVLGGHGLTSTVHYTAQKLLPEKNINDKIYTFEKALKSKNLVNHIIVGDGEAGILDLLQNNTVMPSQYTSKTFDYFLPNYDDYDLDCYFVENNDIIIDIMGSKGCVRDCDMCDVKDKFGNYRFKDGERIADEIIELNNLYGFKKFRFVDSLTNGSLLHFEKFISKLADYNQKTNKNITWSGDYICRDFTTSKKDIDNYYSKLKQSGAEGLTIGAESGSNHVLDAINKQTSVEALFFELEYFRKYNITSVLLMFTGHWSEREQDFLENCRMLVDLVPYCLSSTVIGINLGTTFGLIHGSPSYKNSTIHRHNDRFIRLWFKEDNPSNTLKTRLKRRIIVSKLSHHLNLPIVNEAMYLKPEYDFVKDYIKEINDYFSPKGIHDSLNTKNFVPSFLKTFNEIKLDIELETFSVNSDPHLLIQLNDNQLVNNFLSEGTYSFNCTVDSKDSNTIKVLLSNKHEFDTLVENGQIIKDKCVIFKKFLVNNVDILNPVLYNKIITMTINNQKLEDVTQGLFSNNQMLEIKFPKHFIEWVCNLDLDIDKSWQQLQNSSFTDIDVQLLSKKLEQLIEQLIV